MGLGFKDEMIMWRLKDVTNMKSVFSPLVLTLHRICRPFTLTFARINALQTPREKTYANGL